MRVLIVCEPPLGSDIRYSEPPLHFDLPALPRPGDTLTVSNSRSQGTYTLRVIGTVWHLHHPNPDMPTTPGSAEMIILNCERLFTPDFSEVYP